MDELEEQFRDALLEAYRVAARDCGYHGNYALRMVGELRAVNAAKRLINAPAPANGFTRLGDCQRLDLTIEAISLRAEFAPLFSPEEQQMARNRLRDHGYDPEGQQAGA